MKKLMTLLLFLAVSFLSIALPVSVNAADGNIDGGGGGGMGDGINNSFWSSGQEGVRVSIVQTSNNKTVFNTIDLTNKKVNDISKHFEKKSKLQYKSGAPLKPIANGGYSYKVPTIALPKVISESGGNANIDKIKKYFCSEGTIRILAEYCGVDSDPQKAYETLTNGEYKLLLEPVAYFTFRGDRMAMTATEAAKYDEIIGGQLSYDMHSFTRKNLPLSMFLEVSDLGFPKYTGKTNVENSNKDIILSLGLGIVRFETDPDSSSPGEGSTGDGEIDAPGSASYEYRANTDVITTVTLTARGNITPDDPASVTFHVLGGSYTVSNIVIPKGESQIAWMKWHTPSTPQTVPIRVTASGGKLETTSITAKIVDLNENPPPDPQFRDRNDYFVRPSVPRPAHATSGSWSVWSAKWIEHWVKHSSEHWVSDPDLEDGGYYETEYEWVDEGWWEYKRTGYEATLHSNIETLPDDKVPTANGKRMKSGYGLKIDVTGSIVTDDTRSAVTPAQTAVAYFPEFKYKDYWRLLDLMEVKKLKSDLKFKVNKYSAYGQRVHFTPLWYPDGDYTTYAYLMDAWTPAGMLSANLHDTIVINGNMYQDWHVAPLHGD